MTTASNGRVVRVQESGGVSLVVVNHNSGTLLLKCIQSARHQVDELLIVDNASSDSSLSECEARFAEDPQIRFIRNDSNLGFAVACNIGLAHSKGNFVLFLNPDCQLDDGAVDHLRKAMIDDTAVGMVGGLLVNPDGSEQGGGRRAIPTPWRSFVRAFGLYRLQHRWPRIFYDFYLHKLPLPEEAVEVEAISGACMMVKREAISDIGQWDESYFLHCEDLDWCMRFRAGGWKILFVPDARVVHMLGACSRARPVFVEWHKHKGMLRFYRKYFRHQYPYGLMALVTVGVWIRFLMVATFKVVNRKR